MTPKKSRAKTDAGIKLCRLLRKRASKGRFTQPCNLARENISHLYQRKKKKNKLPFWAQKALWRFETNEKKRKIPVVLLMPSPDDKLCRLHARFPSDGDETFVVHARASFCSPKNFFFNPHPLLETGDSHVLED